MITLYLISSILFFITTSIFLYLFINIRIKNKIIKQNLNNSIELCNKYKNIIKSFDINKYGYYIDSVNLVDKHAGGNGDLYKLKVHINEIDRYKNGDSKIELLKIEIIYGFNPSNFDWAKQAIELRFSTIKKTNEIEWLESEDNIKENRKNKIKEILNKNK